MVSAHLLSRHRHFQLTKPVLRITAHWDRMQDVVRLGGPACLQTIFEVGVFSVATLAAGKLGATALAAHHIVLQIASTTFMVPLGISASASALVGQAFGARRFREARELGNAHLVLGVAVMATAALTMALASHPLLSVFTSNPEVIEVAQGLLWIAAGFQIFDGIQVVATGALRGFGNTLQSAVANFVGHWCIGLPTGLALAFPLTLGVNGLWAGLSAGLVAVSGYLFWRWWRYPLPSES